MPRYLLELVLVIFIFLIIFISMLSGTELEALFPTLSMFGVASMRLIPSMNQVMNSILKVRQGQNTVEVLYKDFVKLNNRRKKKLPTISSPLTQNNSFCELQLQAVQFSYPQTNQSIINNATFSIKSGESIGIMGQSGSGKTTLIDLMLGLLNPQKGEILVNGVQLTQHLDAWRSQVAYLPQEVFLIDDTLRNNIALEDSKQDIDEKKIKETIQKAQLSDFIRDLPGGLDTVVGEKGVLLSGGQRQRLALARAFYYDRDVLIMDESTSALDDETEREIIDEIKFLHGKKTLIVIAHSLKTLQYCDRIYKIDNGIVTEESVIEV
jgi:ABC-type multidrug transport system fused ATPase/permease subunit